MRSSLILEITRTKELMGIISEQGGIISISDDIVKGLKSLIKSPTRELSQDLDLLSQIVSRGGRRVSQNDLVVLLTRIIRNDKKIADYLIPKIIQNLDVSSQNFIQNFKTSISNFKSQGGKYKDAIRGINANLNARNTATGAPVFNTPIPEIKEYLKKDFERYAWELYNPIKAKVKSQATKIGKNTGKGFKEGWNSKSGGFLTLRSVLKAVSPEKAEKLFPNYFKKLTPEERQVMWKWVKWGVPDIPSLKNSWNKLGIGGWVGNISAQILHKTLWLMLLLTGFQLIRDYIQDYLNKGEEYAGWNEFAAFAHRIVRAFDVPHLGVTSPMIWLIGLVFQPIWAGMTGSDKSFNQRFKDYLIGEDESNIPKPPERLREWLNSLSNNTDTLIDKTKNRIDTLTNGTNVKTDDILPDSITIPNMNDSLSSNTNTDSTNVVTPVATNTEEVKNQLYNHLKTIPSLNSSSTNKIGPNDKPYIFDKGNNLWEFQSAGDSTMKFQYNPQTKTFSQIR